ncbi:MAG: plasmid recombination protein [Ruminococcus sp.]|nr:plasmid recombination protein [Ruminococcus sp.]
MPKTISFHNGSMWSRGHNIRDERYVSKQEHINSSLTANNIIVYDMPVRQAYEEIFGQAVQEYNDRQTRKDRKIDCYYDKIKNDKRKHTVYECIVQIGDRNDTGNNAELEKQALIQYAQTWAERNPNLHLIGAYIHCDEPDGTVHLHCDYIPVAECSRGMSIQNSLDKALRQQGLQSININQTAQMDWQTQERTALMSICQELNIDVQLNQERTKGRRHLTTAEYKAEKNKLEQVIEQELQPLRDELQEYTDIKRDFENIAIQTTKIPIVRKVVVSEAALQEVENQAKSYRAVRRQLETLESREETVSEKEKALQTKELELAEREKRCQKTEIALDKMKKILEKAEKDVKRYSSELSYKKNELIETTMELEDIRDQLYDSIKKYDSLMETARNDCCLIRDFIVAMKMLLYSDNSSYKANLTEEQTNLIKSIINIAKELLKKRNMPQSVTDIENKCEISALILSEIKKLTPSENQPMFSIDRIKSDEFNPTSQANTHKRPIHRGR